MLSGAGKVHPGAWTEQSQVVVETVTKSTTTQKFAALQQTAASDASKVVTRGTGLQRAFINKEQTFQVDASKAGASLPAVQVDAFNCVTATETSISLEFASVWCCRLWLRPKLRCYV